MSEFFKPSKHKHFLGSKLSQFISEDELPAMIEKSLSDDGQIVANDLDKEPQNELFTPAASIKYTSKNASLLTTIINIDDRNEFCSMVACLGVGLEYSGQMECVYVWNNGAEAQIELSTGAYTMIFYDENFVAKRAFYKDGEVKARIYGVAFSGGFVENKTLKITANEAHVSAGMAKKIGEEIKLNTGQMTMWMPFFDDDEQDIDEVNLRGEVVRIKKFDLDPFDKTAFVLTLRVFDESDDEKNFEVVFTDSSWQEEREPQIGDFVGVYAGLCGEIIR